MKGRAVALALAGAFLAPVVPGEVWAGKQPFVRLFVKPAEVVTGPGTNIQFTAVASTADLTVFSPGKVKWRAALLPIDERTGRLRTPNYNGVFVVKARVGTREASARVRIVGATGKAPIRPFMKPGGTVTISSGLTDLKWHVLLSEGSSWQLMVKCRPDRGAAHHISLYARCKSGARSVLSSRRCQIGAPAEIYAWYGCTPDKVVAFELCLYDQKHNVLARSTRRVVVSGTIKPPGKYR